MDAPVAPLTPELTDVVFVPTVTVLNQSVKEVFESQLALSEQLASMVALLERFLAESPQAPNLSEKLVRLAEAKDRMARVNATLDKIQARLDRLREEHVVIKSEPTPK